MACCPGSGSSVLSASPAARGCDLWLTGEMSHHELLDAAHLGASVVLAEHSNSERRFLSEWLRERVESALGGGKGAGGGGGGDGDDGVEEVWVSQRDRDPVQIV